MLETAGWNAATAEARDALEAALARIAAAGVAIARRGAEPELEAIEAAIADAEPLTRRINAWEGRWPLNTYRNRDRSKLSDSALSRLATAEAMTLADYGAALARRRQIRETFAALARSCDMAVTLAATGPAPLGLGSTGNPVFAVPGSILGVPSVSLPVLSPAGLPLGLQVVGFEGGDARLFAGAAWLSDLLVAAA